MNIVEKCEELDSLTDIKNIQERALEELKKEIEDKPEELLDKDIIILFENFPNFLPNFPPCFLQYIGGYRASAASSKGETVIDLGS